MHWTEIAADSLVMKAWTDALNDPLYELLLSQLNHKLKKEGK